MPMQTPDVLFGALFEAVQMEGVFEDSKTFVDCTPKMEAAVILAHWVQAREAEGFDLKAFVEVHFDVPVAPTTGFVADVTRPIEAHIEALWPLLTRQVEAAVEGSSLLNLPFPYIVPGGRFGEIYYWDSYFTMLGLEVSGRVDMMESMVNNFSHLIETIGHIPNGNRTYFVSRSQPPFFACMVELLAAANEAVHVSDYLGALQKEYDFWMAGKKDVKPWDAHRRVVALGNGDFLNRYWDDYPHPRQESYREDVELGEPSEDTTSLFRHLRAGCESGWDFSSRWLQDAHDLGTIHTADLCPVDLNALLWQLETTLAKAYLEKGHVAEANQYEHLAKARQRAIDLYLWDDGLEMFGDYSFQKRRLTGKGTAAMFFPLFFGLATPKQAHGVIAFAEAELLKSGGIVTTPILSGQQWDAPNGWAPLQWIAYQGAKRYEYKDLAKAIAERWIALNQRVYQNTGKMMEKYNVEDMGLDAGGGEYPVQDGFGWSNGVLLKLMSEQF